MEDSSKKHKVLIVDDDKELLDMLCEVFSSAGFKVIHAGNGVDATFKYNNETFDLIITDIKMPKKDGVKFIQHIHLNEKSRPSGPGKKSRKTPIIVISGNVEDYKKELSFLESAEIIAKPFSPKEILDKASKLISPNP